MDVSQPSSVLKTLSKNYEREIKAIYDDEGSFVSQLCRDLCHLTDKAEKMFFSVYHAPLPHYFHTKIRAIHHARWNRFFTQCIIVFHNHLSECGRNNMTLDQTVSLNNASIIKVSSVNFSSIPVVVDSLKPADNKHIRQPSDKKPREKALQIGSSSAQAMFTKSGKYRTQHSFSSRIFSPWADSWTENARKNTIIR